MSKYIPSTHAEFVDALRECLGLAPLYGPDKVTDYKAEAVDALFGTTNSGLVGTGIVRARVARRMPIDR